MITTGIRRMRTNLNLATNPFGRDRIFYLASGLTGILLLAAALFMVGTFTSTYRRSPELDRRIDGYRRQLATLAQKQAQLDGVLRRPENSVVLEQSLFLNDLLYRKGISWTRTFADLEQLMPPRVRLIGIRPQVNAENEVSLDMQIGTETREAFVEFLKAVESSEQFRSAMLHGDAPPTENQPLFRFRLTVTYDQKL
jgi:type IV pilus assembly protein PilN